MGRRPYGKARHPRLSKRTLPEPFRRLVLEKGSAGTRYHAVAEEGVPARKIAEAIDRGLKVPVVSKSPEEAAEHFGWLGFFVSFDLPSSSGGCIAHLNGS